MRWAIKPADEEHAYGHAKAEYFSAGVEGALILVAAIGIAVTAIDRLLDPQPIDDVGVGLAVSAVATSINLGVGYMLLRAGRRGRSIILEADGKHLITDVVTSLGVIVGVAGVALTGWERLDPLIGLAVGANILLAGAGLIRRSGAGLMDRALSEPEVHQIDEILERFRRDGVAFHALRTRQAGSQAFMSVHVLVPGSWSVQRGHNMAEAIETELRARLPYLTVLTHLEPAEDPRSFDDATLDRRT